MPEQVNAAIYARISKLKGRVIGTDRQIPPCQTFADEQGWTVRKVYVDNGISAFTGAHRAKFERMLADVHDGRINAVVSWQVDRLLRTVEDATAIIRMHREHGTRLANVGGEIDLSTADGRKQFIDLANAAEHESARRSERGRLKHDELGQAGRWWGGRWRPFGFRIAGTELQDRMVDCTLVVDLGEAAEIRGQVDTIINRGGTCSGVAADWNRRHITRTGGGRWQAREVRELLTNPRIAGQRRWKDALYPAQWPPIITLEVFDRLQVALQHPPPNARRGRGPLPRSYLLSGGLAVCGCEDCGRPLRPHGEKGHRAYRCDTRERGCGKIARAADPIEDYVRDLVLAAFDDETMGPELRAQLDAKTTDHGGRLGALLDERKTLDGKLHDLEVDYFDDLLTRDQFARGQARVKARLADLQAQVDAAVPVRLPVDLPEGLDALHAAWRHWSMEERRRVVAFALKRVVVKPVGRGYRFDGGRDLRLDWRV